MQMYANVCKCMQMYANVQQSLGKQRTQLSQVKQIPLL